ncbi:cell wall-binding repeat-containing protein [Clostridium sp. A1-XYC3]|uniref:Cell wall-binding repeat-containing protein n=1 Tax=Clostridium tanneri TaxID=3037988 RepID=A0ABU4JNY3_9CLOT|nr:cell wall-binding repeat-containing protein [Clostridium sp. A1-XYC3]MDW8799671.1 cell wall-binding repeat-containing protein [Clostridium sp. A1-XYC3]
MIRKKKYILALILTATLSTNFFYKVSAAFPGLKRLYGEDRYTTSLKVAQDGWSSSYYAILACGEDYPDALSAVPLAKKYNAPILLTHRNYIDSSVLNELKSLQVQRVVIIGGAGSVSEKIVSELNSLGISTERIGGADRYETSIKIAEKFGNVDTLTVATGEDYADAISVGAAAAAMEVPVVLVPKNTMPNTTKEYINRLRTIKSSEYSNPQNGQKDNTKDNVGAFRKMKVFVVGDNNIVSDNVVREFENTFKDEGGIQQFGNVERIIGQDKYERNINIVARFLQNYEGKTIEYDDHKKSKDDYDKTQYSTEYDLFNLNNIFIASGDGFADALSGAALAAKTKSPVILSGNSNSQMLKNFILDKIPNYDNNSTAPEYLTVLGGEAVMPDNRVNDIFGTVIFDSGVDFTNSSVKFKDKQFEKLVRDKVGIHDRELHYSDLKNITSLDLSNKGIGDITGLEYFSGLQSLDLSYNQITNVKPIIKLYALENLNLSHNQIMDISYISNLRNLKQLSLSDNKISNLDDSRKSEKDYDEKDYDKVSQNVFKYLTNLTFLDLSNSNIKASTSNKNRINSGDLDNLKVLTNLVSLNLKGNSLGSLSDLEKLTSLKTLNLSKTGISSLTSLEKLVNLEQLDISLNNNIDGKDLKPLQKLYNLKYLDASSNNIDDLTYIGGLTYLNTLYLEDNPIRDYTPILNYKNSLYYRDFDAALVEESDNFYSTDSIINGQIKNQISEFESAYNYSNYSKLKLRQLYRPYDLGAYNTKLTELYKDREWLNSQLSFGGLSALQLKDINDDLTSIEDQIADINKKDDMNRKVKDLQNQLITTYTPKDMAKIINEINYIYADYRYDDYRVEVDRCSRDIEKMKAQLQIISMQSPSYSGASSVEDIKYELEQRQRDLDFAQEKVGMYDNYRNFFNAISSVIEEN